MLCMGIDLGNKSRNAISIIDEDFNILELSTLTYDGTISVYQHRKNICKQIKQYIKKYNLTKKDYMIFEKINLFRGSRVSKLANITSLAFIQATLINEFSNKISISEVSVQSWKSKVLSNRCAKKEDSVQYIETNYPYINLDILVKHKRKADEIIKDDDSADSICIGIYGHIVGKDILNQKLVNYT